MLQFAVVGDQGVLTQEILGEVSFPQGQGGILQQLIEVHQDQPQQIPAAAVPAPAPKPPKPPEIQPPARKVNSLF